MGETQLAEKNRCCCAVLSARHVRDDQSGEALCRRRAPWWVPEQACLRAQHHVLHNSTHTIFLLHQMNQFLQNFIQHPEEAEREREGGGKKWSSSLSLLSSSAPCTPLPAPECSIPALDVEVLAQYQVFEGRMPGERWEDGE